MDVSLTTIILFSILKIVEHHLSWFARCFPQEHWLLRI